MLYLCSNHVRSSHRYPDLHIYHYAPYEQSAIKRLAGQHGTCAAEVDQLLRAEIFVDLYRIVRQALRASVESYSIKRVEALYGFRRKIDARDSVTALQTFEAVLTLGSPEEVTREVLDTIEAYNRDDCFSVSNATLFANAGWFRKIKCKHGNAMCKWQRKLVRGTSWRARAWGQHVSFQKHPLKTWIRLLSADGECRLCD